MSPYFFFWFLKKECLLTRRESGIRALPIRVPPLRAYDTAEVPHRPSLMLEVLLHLPHGPPILVGRLIRIERSKVLIDLLLQSISCCSLLFTPQLSPCCSPLTVCLSPRCEALLSLSLRGGGRLPSLFQRRRPIAVCVLYSPDLSLSQPHRPIAVCRRSFSLHPRSSLRSSKSTCERSSLPLAGRISVS